MQYLQGALCQKREHVSVPGDIQKRQKGNNYALTFYFWLNMHRIGLWVRFMATIWAPAQKGEK